MLTRPEPPLPDPHYRGTRRKERRRAFGRAAREPESKPQPEARAAPEPEPQPAPEPSARREPGHRSRRDPEPEARREPGRSYRRQAERGPGYEPERGWAARAATGAVFTLVLVLLGVGLAGSLTAFYDVGVALPPLTPLVGAAVVTTVLCGLGSHRIGGHTVAATTFAALASAGAIVVDMPWLQAGVAALTAFAATVLGIVATRPAKTIVDLVREYAIAIGVSLVGAVAVAAYAAPLQPLMLGHVVLLTSLVAMLWVAHRLGGGFHGLGKRGALVIFFAVVVLVVGMAYGEALRRWGSPALTESVAAVQDTAVSLVGAVPRPLELFIGFPALVWGLATRATLRQGWWVCAFGCLGLAGVATSLSGPGAELGQELLSTLYSVLVGLVLGFIVWRIDRAFTGPRGRRARRDERAMPLRPEPSRSRPLL